jgi:hypothetical protein
MNSTTYADVLGAHDVEIPAHLVADAEVPVVTGMQRQGDIIVIPATPGADTGTIVPAAGIAVVRGENGGNTHLLVGDLADPNAITWRPTRGGDQMELGTVTVPAGRVAHLIHPEHGAQGIGEGTYRIRRQREQADEIRMVAD